MRLSDCLSRWISPCRRARKGLFSWPTTRTRTRTRSRKHQHIKLVGRPLLASILLLEFSYPLHWLANAMSMSMSLAGAMRKIAFSHLASVMQKYQKRVAKISFIFHTHFWHFAQPSPSPSLAPAPAPSLPPFLPTDWLILLRKGGRTAGRRPRTSGF